MAPLYCTRPKDSPTILARPLTFGFEEMDALAPFIDDIHAFARRKILPSTPSCRNQVQASSRSTEGERRWPVGAAPDGSLLKRAVKAAARAMGSKQPSWRSHITTGLAPACTSIEPRPIRTERLCRRSDLAALPPCARRHARHNGGFHGGLGAVGERLPRAMVPNLMSPWLRIGASRTARSPCAFARTASANPRRASRRRCRRQSLSRGSLQNLRHEAWR